LKFIQSDSEFVQWVEILNDISDKSKNVLLGSGITKSLPIEVLELKSPIRATFLEKFECVISSSSNCKKASSEE
jgi:hypothetical protein